MFPRLERFDVDFDLPDAFIPEFPPAIFLSNRPELGDVSRGEVVSINNYYRLFKDILTPVQLDGLRLLLTPFPIFFGKGQCGSCHPAPFYLDNQMHDLHLERLLKNEPGDGPIKAFTLRGIKESPPYMHDGRCFTLEDTVEFFNLVLELKLNDQEKQDLVAFMKQLWAFPAVATA